MVVRQAERIVCQSSRLCKAATMNAPKVPMPAASTGVAAPENSTENTIKIRIIGAAIWPSKLSLARADAFLQGYGWSQGRVDIAANGDIENVEAGKHEPRYYRADK